SSSWRPPTLAGGRSAGRGTEAVLNGRVWIATMTAETARATIRAGDVVIVGNQPEMQQAALAAGAGCLIVTDDAPLDGTLRELAKQQNALLLRILHSPFAAALLLQQSVPVDRVMVREMPSVSVHRDMLLQEAKAQLRGGNQI